MIYVDEANKNIIGYDSKGPKSFPSLRLRRIVSTNTITGYKTIIANVTGADVQVSAIDYDSVNHKAIIVSQYAEALESIDLATGISTIISDINVGSGTNFITPVDVSLDTSSNTAYVADLFTPITGVIAVDMASGARRIVSNYQAGSGPLFENFSSLATNNNNDTVYVADRSALLGIDVVSGNRSVVASDTVGAGVSVLFDWYGEELIVDPLRNRAIVFRPSKIIGIDLTTGDRTILSSAIDTIVGTGPDFGGIPEYYFSSSSNHIYTNTSLYHSFYSIDLNTGNRSFITNNRTGSGAQLASVKKIDIDKNNNHVVALDEYKDENNIFVKRFATIDVDTGVREIFNTQNNTAADDYFNPVDFIIDNGSNRILTANYATNASIVAVDMSTGDRTIVSRSDVGNGESLTRGLKAIDLDKSRNSALVIVGSTLGLYEIIAVDLNNGNRVVISGPGTGQGPTFVEPVDLAMDNINNKLYVLDRRAKALLLVDIVTGNRSIISNNAMINSTFFDNYSNLAINTYKNIAYVSIRNHGATVFVDLATGMIVPHKDDANRITGETIAYDETLNRTFIARGGVIKAYEWNSNSAVVITR